MEYGVVVEDELEKDLKSISRLEQSEQGRNCAGTCRNPFASQHKIPYAKLRYAFEIGLISLFYKQTLILCTLMK